MVDICFFPRPYLSIIHDFSASSRRVLLTDSRYVAIFDVNTKTYAYIPKRGTHILTYNDLMFEMIDLHNREAPNIVELYNEYKQLVRRYHFNTIMSYSMTYPYIIFYPPEQYCMTRDPYIANIETDQRIQIKMSDIFVSRFDIIDDWLISRTPT